MTKRQTGETGRSFSAQAFDPRIRPPRHAVIDKEEMSADIMHTFGRVRDGGMAEAERESQTADVPHHCALRREIFFAIRVVALDVVRIPPTVAIIFPRLSHLAVDGADVRHPDLIAADGAFQISGDV